MRRKKRISWTPLEGSQSFAVDEEVSGCEQKMLILSAISLSLSLSLLFQADFKLEADPSELEGSTPFQAELEADPSESEGSTPFQAELEADPSKLESSLLLQAELEADPSKPDA